MPPSVTVPIEAGRNAWWIMMRDVELPFALAYQMNSWSSAFTRSVRRTLAYIGTVSSPMAAAGSNSDRRLSRMLSPSGV